MKIFVSRKITEVAKLHSLPPRIKAIRAFMATPCGLQEGVVLEGHNLFSRVISRLAGFSMVVPLDNIETEDCRRLSYDLRKNATKAYEALVPLCDAEKLPYDIMLILYLKDDQTVFCATTEDEPVQIDDLCDFLGF